MIQSRLRQGQVMKDLALLAGLDLSLLMTGIAKMLPDILMPLELDPEELRSPATEKVLPVCLGPLSLGPKLPCL